ncbi:S8 family serine peptidase [Streptomyces sp. NPDC056452]|uniref:S8 family serine peptidase n=1 Tax=Streptomyces sp. NPDC056452 TaxID=3345821 RepID=UPI00368A1494
MNRRRPFAAVVGAAVLALLSLAGTAASDATAAEEDRGYIVVLKDSVRSPSVVAGQQLKRVGGTRTAVYTRAVKGYAATMTPTQATALAGDPQVRFVSPQRTYRASPPRLPAPSPDCRPSPSDRQCQPVFVDRIHADRSSTRSGDGSGSVDVNVAVLDDGIAADVPDLNVRGGVDCLSGSPVVPGLSLVGAGGHGTLVAGIIGARDDEQGLVGVSPGTPLWAVRVATDDEGLITDAALMCGFDWLLATRSDADPGNDIAVANMSFGSIQPFPPADVDDRRCGTSNQDAIHLAVCNLTAAGVTAVASAGNDANDLALSGPAAYDEVIAVTAMADFDGKPGAKVAPVCYGRDYGLYGYVDDQTSLEFSNFARSATDRRHTLAAPGVCVESNSPLPAHHAVGDGTSFAAPAVSGVLALCIHTHRCGESTPVRNLRTLVHDALAYNRKHPQYGYFGDPRRPLPQRYYGALIAADRY